MRALIPVLLLGLGACHHGARHHDHEKDAADRQITVTGTAKLDVQPDEASMSFVFSSTDRRMGAAHKATQAKVDAFVAALAPLGVTREETTLGNLQYSPNYTYPENGPARVANFTASVSLQVKTTDFSRIPGILDAAVDAGLSETGGVTFYSTKLPDRKKEVRDMAIEATRAKAEQLAGGLGAHLGPVRTITESAWDASYGDPNRFLGNAVAQSERSQPFIGGDNSPVTPGSTPLTLNLTVTWSLE